MLTFLNINYQTYFFVISTNILTYLKLYSCSNELTILNYILWHKNKIYFSILVKKNVSKLRNVREYQWWTEVIGRSWPKLVSGGQFYWVTVTPTISSSEVRATILRGKFYPRKPITCLIAIVGVMQTVSPIHLCK